MRRVFFLLFIFLTVLSAFTACTADAQPQDVATAVPRQTHTFIPPTVTAEPLDTAIVRTPIAPATAVPAPTDSAETAQLLKPVFSTSDERDHIAPVIFQTEAGWVVQDLSLPNLVPYSRPDILPETGEILYRGWAQTDPLAIYRFNLQSDEIITEVTSNALSGMLLAGQADFAYLLRGENQGQNALYLRDGLIEGDQMLTDNVSEYISASPDGEKIAFERTQNEPGLYVLDVTTREEVKLLETQREDFGNSVNDYDHPIWSPTSNQLLYNDDHHGFIWGASDGSFAHFFPNRLLDQLVSEVAPKDRNRTLCLVQQPLLFDNMMVDMAAPCAIERSYGAQFDPFRMRTHIVVFHLNPATGDIDEVEAIPYHGRYQLTIWDEPGESVVLLHEDYRVESVSLDADQIPSADLITCQPIAVLQPHHPPIPMQVQQGDIYSFLSGTGSDQPVTNYGDVTSVKEGYNYTILFTREPVDGLAELWQFDTRAGEHVIIASFSIADYLATAPAGVVDASFAFEWLPDAPKVFTHFVPEFDSLGQLPLQRPSVLDINSSQLIELDAAGDVYQAAFANDGRWAALIMDEMIQINNLETGQTVQQIPFSTSQPYDQTISFSPNGRYLAAFEANNLLIVDMTTGAINRVPLSFTDIGLGHYSIWPIIHWLNDDTTIRTLLTQTQAPFTPEETFTVWDIDAATAVATPRETYSGFMLQAEFAPDANYLAYLAPVSDADPNTRKLMIANIFNGTETEYAQDDLLQFGGWNPDGAHFTFKSDQAAWWQLGHICQEPRPLIDAPEIKWLTEKYYLVDIELAENQIERRVLAIDSFE